MMTPERYRRVVAVAGALLALIVLSGAAVRLTEAGLGCEDWPNCTEDRILPEWELHGWIEFGNRLISGVVAIATAAAVLSAYRRRPRRPDLIRWAWGLVAGVVAQILLGAVTVLADLHPTVVAGHFLLSMILLWNAVVLWVRAGAPSASAAPAVDRVTLRLGRLLVGSATVVVLTGTVVTGTGPNSGDSRADRLPFDLTTVARIHSVAVWCLVATIAVLAIRLARRGDRTLRPDPPKEARWLLVAAVAQGAIGYTQFAVGVPPLLVEAHILGAIVVWCLSILAYLRMFDRSGTEPVPALVPWPSEGERAADLPEWSHGHATRGARAGD